MNKRIQCLKPWTNAYPKLNLFLIDVQYVRNSITTIANNTFRKCTHQTREALDSDVFLSPLETFKNQNTILFTEAQKGRGVAISSKFEYRQNLMDFLNGHNKFKLITTKVSIYLVCLRDKQEKRLLPNEFLSHHE